MKKDILTIIPVRMASTRLPNKPIADINGKTMIERVYNQAIKANIGKVIIACDGEEIANIARKINADFVITDPNLPSGTDRIYQALTSFLLQNNQSINDYQAIINLQGDLPAIDPNIIIELADLIRNNSECDIATLASIINEIDQINNPNIVKIALAKLNIIGNNIGQALYFSRSAIPFMMKNSGNNNYFHHIGIYGYKTKSLEKFVNLAPSQLEQQESLEQLRALENNMKILVKIVDHHPISVDTQSDLEIARALCPQEVI